MESQLGDILQSFYTKAFRRLEIDWDTNHPVTERMATKSGFDSLPKLGIAIDTSLASWEAYMETLTDQPTYESIISNNNTQDTFTKAHALFYLIETLPTWHAVLVISYSDTKVKFVELSNPCANLFEELQKPDSDAELKAWFDRVMTSHKLINGIAEIERNLEMVEQGRMQELKRLKASHVSLMSVYNGVVPGSDETDKLLGAMEKLGVDLAVPGAFIDVADGANGDVDNMADNGRTSSDAAISTVN